MINEKNISNEIRQPSFLTNSSTRNSGFLTETFEIAEGVLLSANVRDTVLQNCLLGRLNDFFQLFDFHFNGIPTTWRGVTIDHHFQPKPAQVVILAVSVLKLEHNIHERFSIFRILRIVGRPVSGTFLPITRPACRIIEDNFRGVIARN